MYFKKNLFCCFFIILCLLLFSLIKVQCASGKPDIKDIVVCNVYWEDYKIMDLSSPRVSKFVVTFGSRANPKLMKSIKVSGPDGYTFDISLKPYTNKTLNGYLETKNIIWFMGYDRNGFLKDGRYDITLTYKSEHVTSKGRILKYSDEILDAYLKIKPEFSPTGKLPEGTDLSNITLKWTIIPGVNAHYMTRIGTNLGSQNNWIEDFGWIFEDTILGYGTGNPYNTGINKSEVKVNTTLNPGQWYLWFTEILDSNDLNKINIAIFSKCQYIYIAGE